MNHYASPTFWKKYYSLPDKIKSVADENFSLLKDNPRHPSLHLKRMGRYWSVRAGIHYRALGVDTNDGDILWFWIGSHADYDKFFK